MNSDPIFCAGKNFPALKASSLSLPSGKKRATSALDGKNTQRTSNAAVVMTARRHLMTKSIAG